MKKMILPILSCLFISSGYAVEYRDAIVTGVGINPNENQIRFTIDKDPNAIFLTSFYTGKQHDYVVSLILAAYAAKSTIAFIRSDEESSSSIRHYTNLTVLEVGSITHD